MKKRFVFGLGLTLGFCMGAMHAVGKMMSVDEIRKVCANRVANKISDFLYGKCRCDYAYDWCFATKGDCVLEIGPGIGTMTQYLAESAGQVVAVEIDKNLLPILDETLAEYDNVTIINDDILKVDINKIVEERNGGRPIKVVANLPYYITTPIIMGLFEKHVPLLSVTVMVQKEVADRMQVGPGTKDYGALSLAVQYYAEPYIVANVPPNCFIPRPGVGSAVIRLNRYQEPPVKVKDEQLMFRLIRASFNQRRKTLQNGIANSGELSFAKEQIAKALESLGISANIRGESLSLAEFAALSDILTDK